MTSRWRLSRVFARCSLMLPVLLLAFGSSGHSRTGSWFARRTNGGDATVTAQTRAAFGLAQAGFEENVGQTDARVKYLARGTGYSLFLTETDAVVSLTDPTEQPAPAASVLHAGNSEASAARPSAALRMKLLGARPPTRIAGLDRRGGTRNYFSGTDRRRWRTNIPAYGSVHYSSVYPGIDVLYHDNQGELEYDFIIAAGVDPRPVRLEFEGADTMQVDARGDLILQVAGRTIRQQKPTIYQDIDGRRIEIAGKYRRDGLREVGFDIATYDLSRPLIIDPVLVYSSYVGSITSPGPVGTPHTDIAAIAVDSAGNAYVTGSAGAADFPTLKPLPPTFFGSHSVFVAKFSKDGELDYLTFIGGTVWDHQLCEYCGAVSSVTGIAVDTTGSVSIVGSTSALDFPLTPGAFLTPDGKQDGFLTKLSPDGDALAYSTIVVLDCPACLRSIALDSEGSAWMAGHTGRQDLPTVDPLQPVSGGGNYDAVVLKVDAAGTGVVYFTYLGGTGDDFAESVTIGAAGDVYIAGRTTSPDFPTKNAAQPNYGGGWGDCWVARMNHAGSALVFSTYLGGNDAEFCASVAVDSEGSAVTAGLTGSADFPTRNALQSHFNGDTSGIVVKLSATGAFAYSTFLAGSIDDEAVSVAVDSSGNAYVTGIAASPDFPAVGSLQPFAGPIGPLGGGDAFVTKINSSGTAIVYSTFLGSGYQDYGRSIAVDAEGTAYVVGNTGCCDFPTKHPVQTGPSILGIYGFVAKLEQQHCATDITNGVDVVRFPILGIPFTPLRFQWVLIHNRSTVPIAGPLAFAMDDIQRGVFIGSLLTTTCFSPEGDPFMTVPVGSDEVFAPNESVLTGLWFWKTELGPLTYTHHVSSGIPAQ